MDIKEINHIIDKLQEFRLENNYTLQQLSILLKPCAISTLSDILNRKTGIPRKTLMYRIKKLLGI